MPNLIIGSRGSRLALWQSNWVKDQLEETYTGLVINIEIIKTTGDKLTEASLAQIGGKGVFTKEIEEALLDYRIDLAVHSLKDLPTTLPPGLHIAAITEREDVRDALIVREGLRISVKSVEDLPEGARIGTSSLRRGSQLRHARPDLRIIELRGNVETRLRKLDEGEYDAIVLASAGLNRLGFDYRVTAYLSTTEMLPAVGQGALGIEARVEDHRANLLLEVLNHQPTRYAAEAERAVLRSLGGGCAVPIAAFAHIKKNRISQKLIIDALVSDVDGRQIIRHQIGGPVQQADELGGKLAEMLIESGARELLPRIGSQAPGAAQTANGASDLDILTESFAQGPVGEPPEGGISNYPVESYAPIASPSEGMTSNYFDESLTLLPALHEDTPPNYYGETLPPDSPPSEGMTPSYFEDPLPPISSPLEGVTTSYFGEHSAPMDDPLEDLTSHYSGEPIGPITAPPEGVTPNYFMEPLEPILAPPESATTNYFVEPMAPISGPSEGLTPSYFGATSASIEERHDGQTPNYFVEPLGPIEGPPESETPSYFGESSSPIVTGPTLLRRITGPIVTGPSVTGLKAGRRTRSRRMSAGLRVILCRRRIAGSRMI